MLSFSVVVGPKLDVYYNQMFCVLIVVISVFINGGGPCAVDLTDWTEMPLESNKIPVAYTVIDRTPHIFNYRKTICVHERIEIKKKNRNFTRLRLENDCKIIALCLVNVGYIYAVDGLNRIA